MTTLDRPEEEPTKEVSDEAKFADDLPVSKVLSIRISLQKMQEDLGVIDFRKKENVDSFIQVFLDLYKLSLYKDAYYLYEEAKRLGLDIKKGL